MIRSTAGNVTAVAFDSTAHVNATSVTQYQRRNGLSTDAFRYARTATRTNNVESTSRRSVIHATDSTRSGCTAYRSAASADGPSTAFGESSATPINRRQTWNNRTAF